MKIASSGSKAEGERFLHEGNILGIFPLTPSVNTGLSEVTAEVHISFKYYQHQKIVLS